ncbi:3-isopropylmalate dehydratase small subunit [Phycobacter azelaicus]|jgi:3-isopropylmalate/(R)-2-methylmalate dehydratase small subunit|uniref:3-isopropylmalate dehydratase small subunit n=1 Tax=Phycobacter azelaicus TaxID=2668075 RepID=UPI001868B0D1|nr:3-isopropylmalate dehydratase small subunit [Phycobacter azelaicus]MBE1297739.1 3-isopropylmalate dehydratase small subunit [Paracoccaceae bacterium]
MAGWSTHSGRAIALPLHNVDTDQLIPARFMSASRSEGYGKFLLHDMRFDADGAEIADFPLNRHEGASVLVAGRNFGSGSSREAAVYALVDAGITAVIAPNFGDIFASNAVNNGLLPARLPEHEVTQLIDSLADQSAAVLIDLRAGELRIGDQGYAFELDDSWRTKLINGWDDIDLTLNHEDQIQTFKDQRFQTTRWAWPAAQDQEPPSKRAQ